MNKEECIEYVKELGGIETKDGWNVPKSVYLHNKNLTEIPIKFNIVQGNFHCSDNQLTSLKNSPKEVKGNFTCSDNQLTSLKYSPKIVKGFFCSFNKLTSLKYLPKVVQGHFSCSENKLTSFKYAPKIVQGNFYCDKGVFKGKEYYKLLLDEKVITESEYLLRII